MASLKEIKSRVSSIKSIWKITSAMRKIASAKLHRAQNAILNSRLYEQQLQGIIDSLLHLDQSVASTYTEQREQVKRVAIVAFSSNSSLCGAFNTNVARKVNATINERYSHLDRSNILIFPIGHRIHSAILREGYVPQGEFRKMIDKPCYADAAALALQLMDLFTLKQVDCIELVYNRYKSMAVQVSTSEKFLPITLPNSDSIKKKRDAPLDYIIEPSCKELITLLIPRVLKFKIFATLLDSIASEHAARTVAMQLATENAEEMINELTLLYNKSRQQSITNELLDILGGSTVGRT